MEAIDMIRNAKEMIKKYGGKANCAIMNQETAKKLLEHFLEIKCVIDCYVPKDEVCIMQYNPFDDRGWIKWADINE